MTYSTKYPYVYYVIMSDLVLYEIDFLVHLQFFMWRLNHYGSYVAGT